MKNAFYFILKAIIVLEKFTFLWLYVEKRPDKKAKVNFKILDVTDWTANNYKTHNEIWSVNETYPDKYLSSKIM